MAKENQIYGKWIGLYAFIDRFITARGDDYFSRLKYLVGEKINTTCVSDMSLSTYDVEIFDSYGNITKAYRLVADHHLKGASVLKTPEIKGIWEG
ncbi:MAG: hypothetical protein FWC67_03860, partial [Defluviitaleaceae bacterium]|nr:hypothetical protein [Defluviitaleaceae bacterium]